MEESDYSYNLNNQAKPNSNNINNSVSTYLGFTPNFLGFTKALESFLQLCPLQHTQLALQALSDSLLLLLLLLVVLPWYWHLQNAGLFCWSWAALAPIASVGFFFKVSSLSFLAWPTQSWAFNCCPHLHQWPLLASHSAKPQLLSTTPLCLQNFYHLGAPHTTKFGCQYYVYSQLCGS